MSVIGEVVGIVACVAGVISAYHDGGAIIRKIKLKRAARRAPAPPRLLEDSIEQAPEEIEREKRRGISRFGPAFEQGDHIAVIALQQITIQLQGSLLEKLRNDDGDRDTDFLYLVDAADAGRDRTIGALLELRQRLLVAKPIVEIHAPVAPIIAEPRQIHASPQTSSFPVRPAPPTQPIAIPQQQQRTWSRQLSASPSPAHQHDATAGADEQGEGSRRRRHSSLAGFFKYGRSHSGSKEVVSKPDKSISPANAPLPDVPERSIVREHPPASLQGYQYQEWEDDPAQIWGAKQESERRDTVVSIAGSSPDTDALSPTMTDRSPSTASPSFVGCAPAHVGSAAVPTPIPENDYLGFCKSAWKLQNGDRKAMQKTKEFNEFSRSGWSPNIYYLACSSSKCVFAGHMPVDKIWDKVWTVEARGLRFRWAFLAKSHVPQQKVRDHQYGYRCLFCVFLGDSGPVYFGTDTYLEHVSSHRGQALSEVVLYKTKCILDRVASETEEFDIDLFPLDGAEQARRKQSAVLSDDLLSPGKLSEDARDSVHSNRAWSEGLSEFHSSSGDSRAELE
ncbi:hypothetical protein LTR53_009418 [Teratosphaeriaceae sp. CCFEE 6253]|nr:hypothetical protein LTR53_009418 [Teratosphaeriaceae sp. CCFEE 6253]